VPKSPIEQPNRHHNVLSLAFFQVCLQFQEIDKIIFIFFKKQTCRVDIQLKNLLTKLIVPFGIWLSQIF
jgi:hypothetical protein